MLQAPHFASRLSRVTFRTKLQPAFLDRDEIRILYLAQQDGLGLLATADVGRKQQDNKAKSPILSHQH